MVIKKCNGKYTVYGDDGKVIIITSDSRIAQSTLERNKRITKT